MPASLPLASPPRLPYYPALTGLRAVAAYLIFFLHFRPVGSPDWYERLTAQLYVGVSMFFVLSGFVIATRYQGSVQLSGAWWRRYVWRRIARIYPIYFILNAGALAYLFLVQTPGNWKNHLLLSVISQTLLRGFSNTLMFIGLPQAWSLTTEECFYLSAPFLLLAWQRRGGLAVAALVACIVALGLGLTAALSGHPALHGLFGSYKSLFNYMYFGRILEFVAGVALARWWAGRPASAAERRGPWLTAVGVGLMAAAVGLLYYIHSPTDWYQGLRYPAATAVNNLFFPVGVTVLLAGLLAERTWLRTLLATPLAQALGRSSYFFYLFHVGLFSIWWHDTFGWGRHIGVQFLVTVGLSWLGYRYVEEPLRRWVLARTLGRK